MVSSESGCLWTRTLRQTAVVFSMATMMPSVGCDPMDDVTAERVSVTGRVRLDGKPLEAGAIAFHCSGNTEDAPIIAHGYIEDGRYAIQKHSGPIPGPARVVFSPKPLDREAFEDAMDRTRSRRPPSQVLVEIPERYREGSELHVDLITGNNVQDFDLSTK